MLYYFSSLRFLLLSAVIMPSVAFAAAHHKSSEVKIKVHDKSAPANEKIEVRSQLHRSTGTIEQARSEQKAALNIVNVLPQSQIGKLPDINVGDALRRLPGVSVSNAGGETRYFEIRGLGPTLNGVTFENVQVVAGSIGQGGRAVPVDAFPAGIVGGIELFKTQRPDLPADALGGQVNLQLRDMPADGKSYLHVHMASGFYQNHMTNVYNGTIDGGFRFNLSHDPFGGRAQDKLFYLIAWATAQSDWRYLDDTQPAFSNGSTPRNALSQVSEGIYANHRVHWGYGGVLGWDINTDNHLYFKASDGGYDTSGLRYQQVYNISSNYAGAATGNYAGAASLSQATRDLFTRSENRFFKFGGTSSTKFGTFEYWGAYNSNFVFTPYQYGSTFTRGGSVPVIVHDANTGLPTVGITNGVNPNDYSPYRLSGVNFYHQNDMDSAWDGHVGWKAPLDFGPLHGEVRTGGGIRMRAATNNDITTVYTNLPMIYAGNIAGSQSYSTFGGLYNLGYPVGSEAIRRLVNNGSITPNVAANYLTNSGSLLADNENIYNGYAEYAAHWGKLGILSGVRIEKTDGIYKGNTVTQGKGGVQVTPNHVGQEYTNFFPTVQFRYEITKNLLARAGWATAIARPGFNQITAATSVNLSTPSIARGNPALKPTTGNSFDADVEYYLPEGGIASVGVFDKEFRNYIVSTTQYVSYPGIAVLIPSSTYANLPYGSARGIELNYRQTLNFLPGVFKHLGIQGNWTYVKTRGPNRPGAQEGLPYTTPHTFNFGLFYHHGPLDLTFDGNYQGTQMQSLGTTPGLDVYQQRFMTLDMGGSYAITKFLSANVQVRNLTNAAVLTTQGAEHWRVTEYQAFGREFLFGLDAKL
ncbi:TonB-dependent receptor [Neokomagataea anthophila]|uniref:TonB-dependent receptor n=1 Tax=Neokomagataea anthophila TaxID=2826925 RepID=A0ABS5E968_9PROT|nr:TonB-dependent receptor [Neokomagataea anthophila]MBR0560455.1 TonB-dependent receptor [Neokomagataea anthophila]